MKTFVTWSESSWRKEVTSKDPNDSWELAMQKNNCPLMALPKKYPLKKSNFIGGIGIPLLCLIFTFFFCKTFLFSAYWSFTLLSL